MLQMRRGDHSTKEQILFLISPNPNSQDLYDKVYRKIYMMSLFIKGSHYDFVKITRYQFILMHESCFKNDQHKILFPVTHKMPRPSLFHFPLF